MYLCLRLSKCQISLSKLRFEEFICGPQFSAFAVTVSAPAILESALVHKYEIEDLYCFRSTLYHDQKRSIVFEVQESSASGETS
ncbi:hypothetical protein TYRP_016482 [Tyrophagus putrescentiae]|nr:hypothetical protein TYRP_016482 [Tyrophagus putrescentiae]